VVCRAVAAIAGPIIELKRASEVGLPAHAGRSAKGLWDKIAGSGHFGFKLAELGTVALAAFFALMTGNFRVAADATLQGVVQRAVTAPINGFVKEAPLRAGDLVTNGQVVGRFDDRDLRIERVKLAGEREQYDRQYREAMSKRERDRRSCARALAGRRSSRSSGSSRAP
jgi:multidrug efflux pump subunit AcrA (membrane-fusion protein)